MLTQHMLIGAEWLLLFPDHASKSMRGAPYMDDTALRKLAPMPDIISEHIQHHGDNDFHTLVISVAPNGGWYATDTGDCGIDDSFIAATLANIVEDLMENLDDRVIN